jgi:hypothetical protein
LGIGDWGLGIGDWAQSPIPNPQSPIPNPQSPKQNKKIIISLITYYTLKNNYLKKIKINFI